MPWPDARHVAAVEALMERLCAAGDQLLGRLLWEHVASGGKRLRARLALAAVEALGERPEVGVPWGAACELLHNASLVHDDIQDGDELRRGRPSLWARHGVAQAINAGDLGITLAYLALEPVAGADALRFQLALLLARASHRIVLGQASEMRLLSSGPPRWSEYVSCVEGKTSALFALPVEGAALLAGRSAAEATALADACRPVGLLFQIQDDILDLYGDNGRAARGSDLAQGGKVTALVLEHLRLHPRDGEWLLPLLSAPRERTPRAAVERAIERFAEGGALAAVWGRIDELHRRICASPVLAAEPSLAGVTARLVAESLRPVEHTRPRGRS